MREFDSLDQTSLKAFMAASHTLNFTAAARRAAMTQSGVSQHVARLERTLSAKLFTRSNRGMKLTPAGVLLQRFVAASQTHFGALLEDIRAETEQLRGEVRYAMPMSCMLSPHFPLLLRQRAQHGMDGVTLKVSIGADGEVIAALLDEAVHFGFVCSPAESTAILSTPFCLEEYVLVGPPALVSPEDLRTLPMIVFPGAGELFRVWHTGQRTNTRIAFSDLPVAAEINELYGVQRLLEEGVGCAVIARHCVADLLARHAIIELLPRAKVVHNQVQLVTLAERPLPRRVRAVIDAFHAIVAEK